MNVDPLPEPAERAGESAPRPVLRQKLMTYWDCGYPCGSWHFSEKSAWRCIQLHVTPDHYIERDQALMRAVLVGTPMAQIAVEFDTTRQNVLRIVRKEFDRIGELNVNNIPCAGAKEIYANRVALLKLMERRWRLDRKKAR